MSVYDRLTQIARPLHVHGVSTPEAYEALQRSQLARLREARPMLTYPDPWDSDLEVAAWIAGGKWIVTCVCGNAPAASPEWNIARCLECGAVYRSIVWPDDAAGVEAALVVRGTSQRSWLPGETLDELRTENVTRGMRVTL